MQHLNFDGIIYICQLLTSHDVGTPARVNYLCAHVLPGLDIDAAPYRKTLDDWKRYLTSYGIRDDEQRWVIDGIIQYVSTTMLHDNYQKEYMAHIYWSLKHVGNSLDLNEKPAESDAQTDDH